jgi:hypothetical protein
VPVNDAQRYRMNAAQCLTAAEQRETPYRRRLAFTIAAYWLALERYQAALDELVANGGEEGFSDAGDAPAERRQRGR